MKVAFFRRAVTVANCVRSTTMLSWSRHSLRASQPPHLQICQLDICYDSNEQERTMLEWIRDVNERLRWWEWPLGLCCFFPCLLIYAYTGEGTRGHETGRRDWKDHLHQHRPPSRPRCSSDLTQHSFATYPQPRSLFFQRLPPEIRRCIYIHALGNNIVHIAHVSRRLIHNHAPLPPSSSPRHWRDPSDPGCRTQLHNPRPPQLKWLHEYELEIDIPRHAPERNLPVNLLRTCHALHAEAVHIVYSENVFSFSSEVSAPLDFLYFHDLIVPPNHFAHIHHLRFNWRHFVCPQLRSKPDLPPWDLITWTQFWDIVAQMHLTSLAVDLEVSRGSDYHFRTDFDERAVWFTPMMKVTNVLFVDVRLTRMGSWEVKERCPQLERVLAERWTQMIV